MSLRNGGLDDSLTLYRPEILFSELFWVTQLKIFGGQELLGYLLTTIMDFMV